MNLFLIGYRGTGKSTVGKIIACKLRWPFYDTDTAIEEEAGMSIRELVRQEGWRDFRTREKNTLAALTFHDRCVVATGGGVVTDPENVARMRASGIVCWLVAEPMTICRRMMTDPQSQDRRPPLNDAGLLEETVNMLAQRMAAYEQAAHFSITTDGREPEEIAAEIIALLPDD